ncbi:hypothetical protein Pelo_7077 [Pelomyxa schiedti]|nr:hypothetical protein Pelo_7077 [Pelomyxa schiedti]
MVMVWERLCDCGEQADGYGEDDYKAAGCEDDCKLCEPGALHPQLELGCIRAEYRGGCVSMVMVMCALAILRLVTAAPALFEVGRL